MINRMQTLIAKVWDAFVFFYLILINQKKNLRVKFIYMSCLFCERRQKNGRINFKTLLNNALYIKYTQIETYSIDDLILRKKKRWIINLHEKNYDDGESYLKRYYAIKEIGPKVRSLTEYYRYRIDMPRYHLGKLNSLMESRFRLQRQLNFEKISRKLGYNMKLRTEEIQKIKILDEAKSSTKEQISISLLNIIKLITSNTNTTNNNRAKKLYTQPSTTSFNNQIKVGNQKLIKSSYQVTNRLKQILSQPKFSPPKLKIPIAVQSPQMKQRKLLSKATSQPDLIASVYMTSKSQISRKIRNISQSKIKKIYSQLQK